MRLIDTRTLKFKEFIGNEIPEYAILSHTWGDEEVTFQEFSTLSYACRAKKGFAKIEQTCRLASEKNIYYAWVDTCCIDKSSSAELTEAINSMFAWYKKSVICYAYLSDLHVVDSFEDKLPKCRWFTRGWTLQELIAPYNLEFYDATWQSRGSKYDHKLLLESITSIPAFVISDSIISKNLTSDRHLPALSIVTRMSWAKNRETTRIEDIAYCLLGIFDVNMPLLYGEADKAFIRLQEEIIKKNPDASLFLWEASTRDSEFGGVLAPTPSRFTYNDDFLWTSKKLDFTITNKGIKMITELCSTVIIGKVQDRDAPRHSYLLPLDKDWNGMFIGLVVEKMYDGTYLRANRVCGGILKTSRAEISNSQTQTLYMLPTGNSYKSRIWDIFHREYGCQLKLGMGLRILLATPKENWGLSISTIPPRSPMAFLLAFESRPPTLFIVMSMNFASDESLYVIEYSNPAAQYVFTNIGELKQKDKDLRAFWGLEGVCFDDNGLATTKIRTDTGDVTVRLQITNAGVNTFRKLEISCLSQSNSDAKQEG